METTKITEAEIYQAAKRLVSAENEQARQARQEEQETDEAGRYGRRRPLNCVEWTH